ncbi:MAG: sulfotransferase domain-containing protein [Deltaproteobacteria bacterium]|nr:sulfotransferase domain-containing protein [Deltaproteobacteria bacterium]
MDLKRMAATLASRLLGRRLPAELYIISYPKSGRTWLRALVGKALSLELGLPGERILDTPFMTAAAGLPVADFTHDGSAMLDRARYQDLPRNKKPYRGKKVVLLARGVKDTLVSAYFQATRRIEVFEGPISDFIRSDVFGVMKILTFYRIWHENRHVPRDFLFVRYEDMHRDAAAVLRKVLNFMGAGFVSRGHVLASVEYCSFENMRKAEEQNRFKTNIMSPKRPGDPESYKVRKGRVGGYIEYLSREDIEYIDRALEEHGCEFTW